MAWFGQNNPLEMNITEPCALDAFSDLSQVATGNLPFGHLKNGAHIQFRQILIGVLREFLNWLGLRSKEP